MTIKQKQVRRASAVDLSAAKLLHFQVGEYCILDDGTLYVATADSTGEPTAGPAFLSEIKSGASNYTESSGFTAGLKWWEIARWEGSDPEPIEINGFVHAAFTSIGTGDQEAALDIGISMMRQSASTDHAFLEVDHFFDLFGNLVRGIRVVHESNIINANVPQSLHVLLDLEDETDFVVKLGSSGLATSQNRTVFVDPVIERPENVNSLGYLEVKRIETTNWTRNGIQSGGLNGIEVGNTGNASSFIDFDTDAISFHVDQNEKAVINENGAFIRAKDIRNSPEILAVTHQFDDVPVGNVPVTGDIPYRESDVGPNYVPLTLATDAVSGGLWATHPPTGSSYWTANGTNASIEFTMTGLQFARPVLIGFSQASTDNSTPSRITLQEYNNSTGLWETKGTSASVSTLNFVTDSFTFTPLYPNSTKIRLWSDTSEYIAIDNLVFSQAHANPSHDRDESAALQIEAHDQGALLPRLSTEQRDAIVTPAIGLIIFNNQTNQLECFDGTVWKSGASPTIISDLDGDTSINLEADIVYPAWVR